MYYFVSFLCYVSDVFCFFVSASGPSSISVVLVARVLAGEFVGEFVVGRLIVQA